MGQPFPAVHRRANDDAATKTERARAACDRARQLLDEIDAVLTSGGRTK